MTPQALTKPQLVVHESFPSGRWDFSAPVTVADFTEEKRPAFRVECHCRNCGWKGQARFPVGWKVPLWLYCPKCEIGDLSAHGGFVSRDEKTREEHRADVTAAFKKFHETLVRDAEIRQRVLSAPSKKKGLFR